MANIKLSELTSASSVLGANEFEINEAGTSKKVTATQIEAFVNSGDGALATLDAVGSTEITDNSVGAAELNVSGNGTAGQALVSDADGTMSWDDVGTLNVDAVGTKTSAYTLQTGDVGKYVQIGTGGSITVPNATFSEGDIISLFNNTSGDVTITGSVTTMYLAGEDEDKATLTLATRGVATVLFISGTVAVVCGNVS